MNEPKVISDDITVWISDDEDGVILKISSSEDEEDINEIWISLYEARLLRIEIDKFIRQQYQGGLPQ